MIHTTTLRLANLRLRWCAAESKPLENGDDGRVIHVGYALNSHQSINQLIVLTVDALYTNATYLTNQLIHTLSRTPCTTCCMRTFVLPQRHSV